MSCSECIEDVPLRKISICCTGTLIVPSLLTLLMSGGTEKYKMDNETFELKPHTNVTTEIAITPQ